MAGNEEETKQVDAFVSRIRAASAGKPPNITDAVFVKTLNAFVTEKGADITPFFREAQNKLTEAKTPEEISSTIFDVWLDIMQKATPDPVRASVSIMESVIRNSQIKGKIPTAALQDIIKAGESLGLQVKPVDNPGKNDEIQLYAQGDHEMKTPLAYHCVELSSPPQHPPKKGSHR